MDELPSPKSQVQEVGLPVEISLKLIAVPKHILLLLAVKSALNVGADWFITIDNLPLVRKMDYNRHQL